MSSTIRDQTFRGRKQRNGRSVASVPYSSSEDFLSQDNRRHDNRQTKLFTQEFRSQTIFENKVEIKSKDLTQERKQKALITDKSEDINGIITSETKSEPKQPFKSAPKLVVKPELKPKPAVKTQPKSMVKLETTPAVKPEPNPQIKFGPKTETKPEAKMKLKPKVKPTQDENPVLSPENLAILEWPTTLKHPLLHRWQLWYFKPTPGDWSAGLCKVATFDTIEDFWALYNNIKEPSALQFGCDYSIFKGEIRPEWEDEHNRQGGRWLTSFEKGRNYSAKDVNHMWLEVLMCLIGEAFGDDGSHICGVVVNVRNKMDKISLWTKEWKDERIVKRIGHILKDRTGVTELKYESHVDTSKKTSSNARPLYYLNN